MSMRFQSSKNESSSKSQYEKGFEDLLGSHKISDHDKQLMEEAQRLKRMRDHEDKQHIDKAKVKFEKQKEQDFDDLLSGKTTQKKRDEMSLQDLFKEYYGKAKEISPKGYVNSAKSSINSFSSKLEIKRQQAAAQKKDSAAGSETKEGEQKAEESATHKSEEVKQESTGEQKFESASAESAQQEKVEQEPVAEKVKWTDSMRESYTQKKQHIQTTYPKASKCVFYIKEVWDETFPNESKKVVSKLNKRKEAARQQKEMEDNQEFIDQLQDQIPEWKKGGLTISDAATEEEKAGLFKKLGRRMKSKLSETEMAKQLAESEEYKKIQAMRSDFKEF